MDGYGTAKYLKDNHPDIRPIALSMFDDEKGILRMVQNGVPGYLLKGYQPTELRQAMTMYERAVFTTPSGSPKS